MHGVLGQTTEYPKYYDPKVLFAIARSAGRQQLAESYVDVSLGVDFWHCFEVSWLNKQGISQVAMVRLAIAASSPFIVESKSLKLYLNSFNFTVFDTSEAVRQTICQDLSACLQTQVEVTLLGLQEEVLPIAWVTGVCIDDAFDGSDKCLEICDDINGAILVTEHPYKKVHQVYYSHLLRSNCPVTNQPDWGTVQIEMTAPCIKKEVLLEYILSYRNHNGFHEQCVEQIFADLSCALAPESLMVRAWYTRRGGIDINPVRVSHPTLLTQITPSRLVRQ